MKNVKNIFLGITCSTIFTMILILLFSLIITKTSISEKYVNTVIIIIYGIGMFLGTTIATRKIQKNGILVGASMSIFYILLMYLISSFFVHDYSVKSESIYMIITKIGRAHV